MGEKHNTCKKRVRSRLKGRISDLRKLWKAYSEDPDKQVPDLGTFNEYGLSFDYVAPNTFEGQRRGYFRYQLSWGGPADEFRFFCDENLSPVTIEYWFFDWFDGAHLPLKGKDYSLLEEIFQDFNECGTVQTKFGRSFKE